MSSSSAWSVALVGMDVTMVEVEAAISAGLPRTVLVGLADTALYEARDRCRSAFAASGLTWPQSLVTINLSPASLPKTGSHFDLSIIAAVLGASQVVESARFAKTVMMGEVGLDGRVRPVTGILPGLISAAGSGFTTAIVPVSQVNEARLVDGIEVVGIATVADLVAALSGQVVAELPRAVEQPVTNQGSELDLQDVIGQPTAKWALEVAAAGRHHLAFYGPPGVGKTLLSERMTSILPDLNDEESVEVSAIHSIAGHDLSFGLIRRPPYQSPHHNATIPALVGGGSRIPQPGAISLAHRGVLFLDEAPEFSSRALEALRTPLESGKVTISRARLTATYPARFQLILAQNDCPCGMYSMPQGGCRCSVPEIRRYQNRISGPIRDRIDIHVRLFPLRKSLLKSVPAGDTSAIIKDRVEEARGRARIRLRGTVWTTNGEVPGSYLRKELSLPADVAILDEAMKRGQMSLRGVDRVLRIAWTLADLAGCERINGEHLRSAMALRTATT